MEYQSAEIGKLAEALSAAQTEMDAAKKDSKGNYGKYTTISSILEVVKDALGKNKLAVVQAPMPCDSGNICLRTTLMHSSGQWIASELTIKAENLGPQKIGSAITYARRYALAALLGVGQEDDDAQSAQDAYEKQVRKQQKEQIQQVRQQATANNPDQATDAQRKAIMTIFQSRGLGSREAYINELSSFFGREVNSTKELTKAEASEYIEANKPESPVNDNPFA